MQSSLEICLNGLLLAELWQAQAVQRTGPAALCGLHARCVLPAVIVVHFPQHSTDFLAKLLLQQHLAAAVGLTVIEIGLWNIAAEHLLQAHSLATEL